MTFKSWIKDQLAYVESVAADPDPQPSDFDALRDLVREAEQRAAGLGMPDAVAACAVRPGPITVSIAREALAACLAAIEKPTELTPSQVAKRFGVSADTVRGWIKAGKLPARNVAQPGNRPAYRINDAQIADFDTLTTVVSKPVVKTRQMADIPFRRYR